MPVGFVKLRRGILDHTQSGRLTLEEFAIYTTIILLADHHNGSWRGCALTLSRVVGKSERWCRKVLRSLRDKKYIEATPSIGRGQYPIRVNKYFEKRHQEVPFLKEAAPTDRLSAQKRHPRTPLQEVKQEERIQEAAQTSRGSFPTYDKRPKATELEGIVEIKGNGVKKAYQEFIDLRDAGKIPKGVTWRTWELMSEEERRKALKAA